MALRTKRLIYELGKKEITIHVGTSRGKQGRLTFGENTVKCYGRATAKPTREWNWKEFIDKVSS